MWCADQMSSQLRSGKNPADVKLSLKLTNLKVLHAQWIIHVYHHLHERHDIILNGFAASGTEAYENAQNFVERIENPFRSDEYNFTE